MGGLDLLVRQVRMQGQHSATLETECCKMSQEGHRGDSFHQELFCLWWYCENEPVFWHSTSYPAQEALGSLCWGGVLV